MNRLSLSSCRIITFSIALVSFLVATNHNRLFEPQINSNLIINWLKSAPVLAQSMSPEKVGELIYSQMPELPQENQYIQKETGEVAKANNLVTRIVRYHQYTKARPTRFRLDWKLTLADYLGKNEIMVAERYPGNSTLTDNPLAQDKKVIQTLTMEQRQKLVDLLVSIYQPSSSSQEEEKSIPEKPSNQNNAPSTFQLPRQGGAELLMP